MIISLTGLLSTITRIAAGQCTMDLHLYDSYYRMTEYDDPVDSSNNSEYTYDTLGRRIGKVIDKSKIPNHMNPGHELVSCPRDS